MIELAEKGLLIADLGFVIILYIIGVFFTLIAVVSVNNGFSEFIKSHPILRHHQWVSMTLALLGLWVITIPLYMVICLSPYTQKYMNGQYQN